MIGRTSVLRLGEYIIWRASRHLPMGLAEEREREWTAELPFIVDDEDVRLGVHRMAKALRFAVGQHLTVHRHPDAVHGYGPAALSVILGASSPLLGILEALLLMLRTLLYVIWVAIGGLIFSPLGALPASLVGGVICVVGVLSGHLSGAETVTVLAICAAAGGLVAGVAGGTKFGRVARGRVPRWSVMGARQQPERAHKKRARAR